MTGWSPADAIALAGNHLWQSTLVATVAALLAIGCRRNRAQVRYWLWVAASVKFLIPFNALVAIGGQFSWRSAGTAPPPAAALIETVSQPFSQNAVTLTMASGSSASSAVIAMLPVALVGLWFAGSAACAMTWLVRWRRVRRHAQRGSHLVEGREIEAMRRLAARHGVPPLPIVVSNTSLEPGLFGIFRPVLLWPRGISARLTTDQVDAILAHELCHHGRRDNLLAAVHMLSQAVFWFHPLVWWIGARLVDERERACDEEVIRLGSEPDVYAESILTTCKFSIESPLACVAGVTGSDLKKRIEAIVTNRATEPLNTLRRGLLAAAAIVAFAAPLAVGLLNAPRLAAQVPAADTATLTFEVASVKPNDGGVMRVMQRFLPGGGLETFNVTLGAVIRLGYRLQDFQMAGEPEWVHVDRFDILARAPEGAQQSEIPQRIQSLLAERFKLKAHRETRELPVYALLVARANGTLGPQLRRSPVDCEAIAAARARGDAPPAAPLQPGERPPCGNMRRPGGMSAGGTTMAQLAITLAQFTGRVVVDRTGLTGGFDFDLDFAADPPARPGVGLGGGLPPEAPGVNDRPADPAGVSIFTAVEEQLGLKLDSQTGPVEVLVIDHVEHATPD